MEIPSIIYFSAINFVLFVVMLFFVLRKPVKEFFASRAQALRDHVDASAQAEKEINARLQDIQKKIANVEQEVASIAQHAKTQGQAERDEMITRAEQLAEKMRDETTRIIEQEVRNAKASLRAEAVDAALAAAQEMITKQMSASDRDRLITDYVQQLGASH